MKTSKGCLLWCVQTLGLQNTSGLWPESFLFGFQDVVQLTNKLNHLAGIFFDSDLPA
jgi:hypothetical protein